MVSVGVSGKLAPTLVVTPCVSGVVMCVNRMGLLLGQIPGSNKEQIQRAYGIRDHLVRQQTNCNHQ